ncbi:MAG: ATP-binding protein, partial [Candidatus Aenigmarchaeota archaeon]|nr:ATP-binding protein [Candidatus Aenigmarchaeota archaeon]
FPNAKFIISGSSSLELTDKLAKFLVGRMFSFNLYPFSFGEFLDAKDSRLSSMWKEKNKMVSGFVLEGKDFATHEDIFVKDILKLFGEYAVFGGYPEVIKAEDIETKRIVLKNIYETYLTKDIIELLKITDVMKFRNIVVALSSQHSGLLSFDSLASDCKSYYKEVRQFISILEETYVVRLLSPFHRNVGTELKKNPKSYFLDSGLRNYVIKNFNDLELREDKGGIAEGLAFSALADLVGDKGEIKYWRTLSKAEVDFVIKIGDEIIPIEAKYQNLTKPEISRSFRSFLSAYNPKRAVVLTKDFWDETEIGGAKIKFIPLCYL